MNQIQTYKNQKTYWYCECPTIYFDSQLTRFEDQDDLIPIQADSLRPGVKNFIYIANDQGFMDFSSGHVNIREYKLTSL